MRMCPADSRILTYHPKQELSENAGLRQRLRDTAVDDATTSVLVAASVDSPAPAGSRCRAHDDDVDGADTPTRSRTPSPAFALGPSRPSMDDELAQTMPSATLSNGGESRSGGDTGALPAASDSSPPRGQGASSSAASPSWYGTTATLVTPKTWLGWAKGAAAYASVAVSPARSTNGAADLTPQQGEATAAQLADGGAGNAVEGDGGGNASVAHEQQSSSALALTPPFVRPHSAMSDVPSDAGSSVTTDDAAAQMAADEGGASEQSAARGISAHQALQLGVQGKLTGAAVSDMALHASWALWAGGEDSAPGIAPGTSAAANGRSPRRPVDPDAAALLAAAAGQRRRKAKPRPVEL
jgi:hypothetical protein